MKRNNNSNTQNAVMKTNITLCLTAGLLGWAAAASADVLELKNGQTLNGKYVGGTAGTIRLETSAGLQVIETGQALALTFTGGGTAGAAPATTAPTPAAAAPAPAAAPAATSVAIPAGTTLLVRMVDPVSSRDPQGKRFTTTLDADLAVNGVVVAKAGTKIYGRVQSAQQARRYAGQSKLDLQLTEIALGPNLVPLMTSGYTESGARSGGKTARGAAGGAAIGAIAGGGEGAAKGAAIGALASGLKKGETVSVSPGTLLEFRLQQPVSVIVAQ
jgi:pyruvate/2-oxoglutarate dehydrogenase complex dihydrolipoamide acyltransferase (E2) component